MSVYTYTYRHTHTYKINIIILCKHKTLLDAIKSRLIDLTALNIIYHRITI